MNDESTDAFWTDAKLVAGGIDADGPETGACELAIFERALRGKGEAVLRLTLNGALVGAFDALLATARELGGRLVNETLPSPLGGGSSKRYMFAWPHGICTIGIHDTRESAYVSCTSSDRAFVTAVGDRLRPHLTTKSQSGRVYVVVQGPRGPRLVPLGIASVPLERENYDEQTLEAFDHVAADLASPTPCGRLVLIDGVPGTGKTFVVRGLLAAQRAAGIFVMVPPDLVRTLSGPTLLPMLLSQKQEDEDAGTPGPIILVLEDADECLAPRMSDNIGSVANMLAFGDGIVGSVIDVRMIATTNRPRAEIDDALLRVGRLCRRIPVGPLPPSRAAEIFTRLTGRDGTAKFEGPTTLAEVYALAREHGWEPAPVERGIATFGVGSPSLALDSVLEGL